MVFFLVILSTFNQKNKALVIQTNNFTSFFVYPQGNQDIPPIRKIIFPAFKGICDRCQEGKPKNPQPESHSTHRENGGTLENGTLNHRPHIDTPLYSGYLLGVSPFKGLWGGQTARGPPSQGAPRTTIWPLWLHCCFSRGTKVAASTAKLINPSCHRNFLPVNSSKGVPNKSLRPSIP